MKEIDAQERRRIAEAVGMNEQYLYQCLTRRRSTPPAHCSAIELETSGAVTRRDLRPSDWWLIWPELVTEEFKVPESSPPKEAA